MILLSFVVDVLRGKNGENGIVDADLLRLQEDHAMAFCLI
jgi:hypothetical protein